MNTGPSVRFSGNIANNLHAAASVVDSLNTLAAQVIQLLNNGVDLYTAIQRVVSVINSPQGQVAQVERTTAMPAQPSAATPPVQAFWDPSAGRFRLARWHYQHQQWYWVN